MSRFRDLEIRFKDEIEYHILKALPNLYDSFVELNISDETQDGKFSFDLIFNFNFTVSVRIRKYKYIKYPDLTIRSRSQNGYTTEIDKIKMGLAQIYFYAYMSRDEKQLIKVRMADVDAIRRLIQKNKFNGPMPNFDGTEFISFNFIDIYKENGAIYKYN